MSRAAIVWFRRGDLRLDDQPALRAALAGGGAVIPVFIRDETVGRLGAAARWWLGASLERFAASLEAAGSRLILRSGRALEVLENLIGETGAQAVHWQRLYDPEARARDGEIKAALKARGIVAESHAGQLLHEPWEVETGTGGPYKVFTPFWKAIRGRDPGRPAPAPARIPPPGAWPAGETLGAWRLGRGMRRGAAVVGKYSAPGEAAALARLDGFLEDGIARYPERRDMVSEEGTSLLSEALALGEISPRRIWAAVRARMEAGAQAGGEAFLRQVAWRDFAHHLMFHTPHILMENWREGWEDFDWCRDPAHPHVLAWKEGRTGVDFVDAAMREMFVTGRMHNRARMIAASYLTKHLLVDWRIGQDWFAECLTDWDPANNAMGWQWVAGCGPDAAPYFRIFNPDTQAEKFDPAGAYRRRWIAEGQGTPPQTALDFFEAVPLSARLDPGAQRPAPVVGLAEGRVRALAAYGELKSRS